MPPRFRRAAGRHLASHKPAQQGPSTARRVLVGLLGLLVIAGVVVALLVLTSGNGNKNTSAQRVE